MKSIILLILVIFTSCNLEIKRNILKKFINSPTKELFKVYHLVFDKKYDLNTEEGLRRYKNFKENLRIINDVNSKNLSYKYGINEFADMSKEEFTERYLMDPRDKRKMVNRAIKNLRRNGLVRTFDDFTEESEFYPVDTSDWLLEPRNQGSCGSCWTFSTTAMIEGARYRQTGVKEYLSTQQLLDCDKGNGGCGGGLFPSAVEYAYTHYIEDEKDYEYKAKVSDCKHDNKSKKGTKLYTYGYCSNYGDKEYPCSNEQVFWYASRGPAAVGIDGSALQLYESGIFDATCEFDNHAVALVGYGEEEGKKFWKIRNSWGADWGEKGHVRVAVNDSNINSCYVANEAWSVDVDTERQ